MPLLKKVEVEDIDILEMLSSSSHRKDFENVTIAWFKTEAGKTYQIFVTETPLKPGCRKPASVKNIERFFNKPFLMKKIDGAVSFYMMREVHL